MPVSVSWYDDEQTIIYYEFSGKWTWEEFYPAYEQAYDLITSVDHSVYSICMPLDEQAKGHVPARALTHIPSIIRKTPANGSMSAVITEGRFWITINSVMGKMLPAYRNSVAFVATLEEALARIEEAKERERVNN